MVLDRAFGSGELLPALLTGPVADGEVDDRRRAGIVSPALLEGSGTDFDRFSKARTPSASATDAEKLFRGLVSSSSTSETLLTTLS